VPVSVGMSDSDYLLTLAVWEKRAVHSLPEYSLTLNLQDRI